MGFAGVAKESKAAYYVFPPQACEEVSNEQIHIAHKRKDKHHEFLQ